MDCAEEVGVLKRDVGPLMAGKTRLAFDILNGKMSVRPGGIDVFADDVIEAVGRTGLRAEIRRVQTPPQGLFSVAREFKEAFRAAQGKVRIGMLVSPG